MFKLKQTDFVLSKPDNLQNRLVKTFLARVCLINNVQVQYQHNADFVVYKTDLFLTLHGKKSL